MFLLKKVNQIKLTGTEKLLNSVKLRTAALFWAASINSWPRIQTEIFEMSAKN